ncbi:MAG TPA: FAD-dependent oxidoreductase [Rubrivivax sp.]|nr:FAD-dependent oxidoreductase [Rubrivivax sp.]
MLKARVAIVGGGLSGLYAAALLEQRGMHDYVLLEARESFGGRILTVPVSSPVGDAGSYDLGATWFWPDAQPELLGLVETLGLESFEQVEAGDMLVEHAGAQTPGRYPGYVSVPPARRIVGGMGALIEALRRRLRPESAGSAEDDSPSGGPAAGRRGPTAALLGGCRVRRLEHAGAFIEVQAEDGLGRAFCCRAEQVLLAVPPRLAVATIAFAPALPQALALQWESCATWMAPHAKYLAVYDTPFWRRQGLSGAARSARGPLAEIHDASAQDGGALFGFLGVPAQVRGHVPEEALRAHCRAQLVRLFGSEAASPRAEFLKDWAGDPHTAVAADQDTGAHQPVRLPATASDGVWQNRLVGVASEWSAEFSGYVAGAVDAARKGVDLLAARGGTKTAEASG